ncbi:hypothetical protein C1T31_10885 [Hanstruepera neustonica]|uniref:Uncharacterized protein n=1 Tax=Hanstruepera neustonica TaxID=1445657 RepID=A0A2K1DX92_9FLAO|nr:hypothetical protein [Hanstruepera neustonica]PNQ72645.1 hypothetical protein C1T31_10885 [Hanstruepera neustonica]
MRQISKLLILLLLIGFWSCRDTKEADEAVETEVQQETSGTEATDNYIDPEVDKATEELDKEVKELDDALNELDTI